MTHEGEVRQVSRSQSGRIFSACWPLLFVVGCGGPSYDLQSHSQQGEVRHVTLKTTLSDGRLVMRCAGQVVEGNVSLSHVSITEIDILRIEHQPTKTKVSFMTDETMLCMTLPGQDPMEETIPGELTGRSVVFESVGGRWSSRLLGAAATEKQVKELREIVNPIEVELVPPHPVRLGESWAPNPEKMPTLKLLVGHELVGSVKVTLEQVVLRQGVQCAQLLVEMDVSGKMDWGQAKDGLASMKAKGHVFRSIAGRCDLESEFEGKFTLEGEMLAENQPAHLTLSGRIQVNESTKCE